MQKILKPRTAVRLSLENLECRLNLSGVVLVPGVVDPDIASPAAAIAGPTASIRPMQLSGMAAAAFNSPSAGAATPSAGASTPSAGASTPTATTLAASSSWTFFNSARLDPGSGGNNIGYITQGEFASVPVANGTYTVSIPVASPNGVATLVVNGVSIATPNTGGWQTYQTVTAQVTVTTGVMTFTGGSKSGYLYNVGFPVSLTAVASAPATSPVTYSTSAITVNTQVLTSFTQLNITGTTGNDNIDVKQSGNTITVIANGFTNTYTGTFGNIVIHGGSGNDLITVDPSVTFTTVIYSDGGNDTILDSAKGLNTVVTVGLGTDTVTGNNTNTSFWVDPTDTVSGTTGGTVHTISSYTNGVSLDAVAPSIADPTGTGTTTKVPNSSLWGTGPTVYDVNQGQLADCYLVASLQAFALNPAKLREMIVDLGDGTYAVQYTATSGATDYLRIDGTLPAGGPYANGLMYAHPGASGAIWVPLMEKAYAMIAGSNNYANINYGWMTSVYSTFGIANTTYYPSAVSNSVLYTELSTQLANKNPLTVGTTDTIYDSAPLIADHCYTITGVTDTSGNLMITVRNPWGFDGAGDDSNTSDGFVTLTAAQFDANFTEGIVMAT